MTRPLRRRTERLTPRPIAEAGFETFDRCVLYWLDPTG